MKESASLISDWLMVSYDVASMAAAIRAAAGLPDYFARHLESGGRP